MSDAEIVATRTLAIAGSRRKAVVTICRPVQVDEHEWSCAWRVTGMRRRRRAKGIDAVGALIFALDEARAHLNRTPGRYSIPGFGEHGFPVLVPIGYGWRFASHIDRVITRELTNFVEAEMRRRRQRRRINKHE